MKPYGEKIYRRDFPNHVIRPHCDTDAHRQAQKTSHRHAWRVRLERMRQTYNTEEE